MTGRRRGQDRNKEGSGQDAIGSGQEVGGEVGGVRTGSNWVGTGSGSGQDRKWEDGT